MKDERERMKDEIGKCISSSFPYALAEVRKK